MEIRGAVRRRPGTNLMDIYYHHVKILPLSLPLCVHQLLVVGTNSLMFNIYMVDLISQNRSKRNISKWTRGVAMGIQIEEKKGQVLTRHKLGIMETTVCLRISCAQAFTQSAFNPL